MFDKPCSNCGTKIEPHAMEKIEVLHENSSEPPHGRVAASLCKACLDGTKVIKIVLRRGPDGTFQYDQFTALEMEAKAFGKAG